MQDLRKTLNQIIRTNEHFNIYKNINNNEITITVKQPFDQLGLNSDEWFNLTSQILINIDNNDDDIKLRLNDYFNINIKPKYINIIEKILPSKVLPTILVSILTQQLRQYPLDIFSKQQFVFSEINQYLECLQSLTNTLPHSYAPVSRYVVNRYVNQDQYDIINGVNLIAWIGNTRTDITPYEIYGVQHIWDHYDYNHLHVIQNYDHHRILLLNAIKRTWIATLDVSAGTRTQHSRVNYGYMAPRMLPSYTKQQYEHLCKLNLGTTITPPYPMKKIYQMDLDAIERIITKLFKCLRSTMTLSVVYITQQQLTQERLLGNKPIPSRYQIMLPINGVDNLPIYNAYTSNILPIGDSFNPKDLLINVQRRIQIAQPNINPIQRSTSYRASPFLHPLLSNNQILSPSKYINYVNRLVDQTNDQYSVQNIQKYAAPNGIVITLEPVTSKIIAYISLNDGIEGVNLNSAVAMPDTVSSILTPTTKTHVPDFDLSCMILAEVESFKLLMSWNISNMNVLIINPSLVPSTVISLFRYNDIPVAVHSLAGSNGTGGSIISSLWSFSITNSNIIYISLTESQYLSDESEFELFTTTINYGRLYSIEFIDFTLNNLSRALNSILQSIKLVTGLDEVKLSFTSLIFTPYNVGVRVTFTLEEAPWIYTSYETITNNDIVAFTRQITPQNISVDPIRSLVYTNGEVPRAGTSIRISCQVEDFANAFGYMSTICRYVTAKSFYSMYNYYELTGIVDSSRIAVLDRLKMFRSNTIIKPEQLSVKEHSPSEINKLKFSFFEIVTQTDHFLLYLFRKQRGSINNSLSDYGSADFINIALTDNEYVMYDMDRIDTAGVPGVSMVQGELLWGEPLPYIENNDVLIYNSLLFNQSPNQNTLVEDVVTMFSSIRNANEIYFNLPFMTDAMYQNLAHLNIVTLRDDRYYLKMGTYPEVMCFNQDEITQILATFNTQNILIRQISPTLLDYYFTSRMVQRYASSHDYFNAVLLHTCVPLFACLKT